MGQEWTNEALREARVITVDATNRKCDPRPSFTAPIERSERRNVLITIKKMGVGATLAYLNERVMSVEEAEKEVENGDADTASIFPIANLEDAVLISTDALTQGLTPSRDKPNTKLVITTFYDEDWEGENHPIVVLKLDVKGHKPFNEPLILPRNKLFRVQKGGARDGASSSTLEDAMKGGNDHAGNAQKTNLLLREKMLKVGETLLDFRLEGRSVGLVQTVVVLNTNERAAKEVEALIQELLPRLANVKQESHSLKDYRAIGRAAIANYLRTNLQQNTTTSSTRIGMANIDRSSC